MQLYVRLLDMLEGQGFRNAFAGIALPNDASITLHERLGFTHLGTYRDVGYKLGAWHDVGWWQKKPDRRARITARSRGAAGFLAALEDRPPSGAGAAFSEVRREAEHLSDDGDE
jgi:hypothetical protein